MIINKQSDTRHIIINLFGIKIKIRRNVQKKYNKIIEQIQNKNKKIKVVFIVSENQKWGYQGLYDLLQYDERFEPLVLVSLLTDVHNGMIKQGII